MENGKCRSAARAMINSLIIAKQGILMQSIIINHPDGIFQLSFLISRLSTVNIQPKP